MLRKRLPAILILESDSTWDINVREIMSNFNRHFTEFLKNIQSTQLHNPGWEARHSRSTSNDILEYDPDDPWHSAHWDILSIGQCMENRKNKNISLVYNDTHVPPGKNYWGQILGNQRVIRKSGGFYCTKAYAISQTGAAKLLLRTMIDLDAPVDLVIRGMILSGHLVAYSVMPTIMAQWEYVQNIGMEQRGANSDISSEAKEPKVSTEANGWGEVKKSGSVWRPKAAHPDIAFHETALQGAWRRIFRNESSLGLLYGGRGRVKQQ